jgi:misacylated tRNA(Ala) deacylase
LELDRTVFYPTGGGQPCDTGIISIGDKVYKVIEVKKSGESVFHTLDSEPDVKVGDEVHCKIDWDKRYAYMRNHTAVHVVGGIIEFKYNAMFTGGQIGLEKSRFDFDMPELNRELAENIIEEAQQVIDKGLNVTVKVLSKDEALKIPALVRTEPGKILLESLSIVRVVDIEGFDVQMDGGTHVKNTKEIGRVLLAGFENKGTHRKRIEIALSNP